jgi:hypothetical protein
MAAGHLNIIFHGLFAFVRTDECIEVLAPHLANHDYRAGTLQQEIPLTGGHSYCLEGVLRTTKNVRFPADNMAVLEDFQVINRGGNALHCSIYLPFPLRIGTLRPVPLRGVEFFQGADASRITAKELPLLHVLTYNFEDHERVGLGGIQWTGQLDPGRGTMNLHVFAEPAPPAPAPGQPPALQPAGGPADDHALTSFRSLVRLFPGMDLRLVHRGWVRPDTTAVLGIDSDADQRSLFEREHHGALPPAANQFVNCFSLAVDNS